MRKRKRHIRPSPWAIATAIEWLHSGAKHEARRHYIATVVTDNAEYVLHSRKGWRRFSRREAER